MTTSNVTNPWTFCIMRRVQMDNDERAKAHATRQQALADSYKLMRKARPGGAA